MSDTTVHSEVYEEDEEDDEDDNHKDDNENNPGVELVMKTDIVRSDPLALYTNVSGEIEETLTWQCDLV